MESPGNDALSSVAENNQFLPELSMILIAFCAPIILLVLFHNLKSEWKESGFWSFSRSNIFTFIICVCLGIGIELFISGAVELLPVRSAIEAFKSQTPQAATRNIWIVVIAMGFISPIIEEVIFRGVMLERLRTHMDLYVAVFLESLAFSIVHMSVIQGLYALPTAIILSVAFIWTRSIYYPIAIHIGCNLFTLARTAAMSDVEAMAGHIFGMLIAGAVIIASGMLLLYIFREDKNPSSAYVAKSRTEAMMR
jgi:membrane protease YdiL (CAAX protease family)